MTALRLRAVQLPGLRDGAAWALRWAAFWAAVVAAALVAGFYAQFGTLETALAPAAVFAAWVFCRTFPLAAFGALVFLSGAGPSLFAFTGFPVQSSIEGLCVGIITGAVVAGLTGRRGDPVRPWPGVVLLAAVVALSVGWMLLGDHFGAALTTVRGQWLYVAVALGLAYAPWPAPLDRRLVTGALAVALFLAGYALFRWAVGSAPEEQEMFIQSAGRYAVLDGSTERVIGSLGSGHALAEWMTAFVPFSLAVAIGSRGGLRLLALAVTVTALTAVVGAEVRSALASSIIGVAVVIGLSMSARGMGSRRIIGATLTMLVAASLGAGALLVDPEESRLADRFSAILDPGDEPSFQERRFKWSNALREVDDEPLGHGLGMASVNSFGVSRFPGAGTEGVDSSYLKIAYEQGIVMAILFIVALLAILGALVATALRTQDRLTAMVAAGAAGTLAAFGVLLNFEVIYIEFANALAAWAIIGIGMRQVARTRI